LRSGISVVHPDFQHIDSPGFTCSVCHIPTPANQGEAMTFKKILIGLAVVAGACIIAGAGYRFGRTMAHHDADAARAPAVEAAQR
jgi:hypothetical protein